MHYSITPLGDQGLLVDFGSRMDEAINRRLLGLFALLQQARLPFVTDLVPAYSSLAVYYDSYAILQEYGGSSYHYMARSLQPFIHQAGPEKLESSRKWKVPVCYAPGFGPDLKELSALKNIPVHELVQLHTGTLYRVYMIGFLPGFAYMGTVDERLAAPRKTSPRENVAAGSVGIAGSQTGIYPLRAPGGWQIIGRTPIQVFNAAAATPVLLAPGDEIRFYSITEDEFENYQGRDL